MDIHKDQHGEPRDKSDQAFEAWLDEIYDRADRERAEVEAARLAAEYPLAEVEGLGRF